jgi:uncharacterized protein YjbI with pentapeptide repeats
VRLEASDPTDRARVLRFLAGAGLVQGVGAQTPIISLGQVDLEDAGLRNVHLGGANLAGADLKDADLRGVDLTKANLFGADLTDADLTGTVLTGADLREAVMSGTEITLPDEHAEKVAAWEGLPR